MKSSISLIFLENKFQCFLLKILRRQSMFHLDEFGIYFTNESYVQQRRFRSIVDIEVVNKKRVCIQIIICYRLLSLLPKIRTIHVYLG